jgi:hypothetical protein
MIALIICILGLIVYAISAGRNATAAEIGRIAFAMGLLAWLLTGARVPV